MNRLRFSLIVLILSVVAGTYWMEHQTHTDLQHRLSLWTSRSAKINRLSLGLFESEITDISIPTERPSRFTNDIEVGSITVEYSPNELTSKFTTFDSVTVDRLTVHWNGLFGRNIKDLINSVRASFPKRSEPLDKESDSSIQINRLTLHNTTVFVHIGRHTETLRLATLELHNVEGTHQRIVKQILEQLQAGVAER